MTNLALVESPAQLLHVLEWVHAEQSAQPTRLAVLPPSDPISVDQLAAMADFAVEEGLEVEWFAVRAGSPGARLATFSRLRGLVGGADRLVVGDPFSGVIQALLPFARPWEVVVVDDGTATMEFAAQFAAAEPLQRWDAGGNLARRTIGRWARSMLARHRLRLFTVMPVTDLPDSQVHRHDYDWTRRRFGPPEVRSGVDLLGSSLVESGVVDEASYLAAVTSVAASRGVGGRYFAHRREQPDKLRRVAEASGLQVVRPRVPIEVELRRGPVAGQLVSFPSSVGYTLPLVLAGLGVQVAVQPVAHEMMPDGVSQRSRDFLARLAADARPATAGFAPNLPRLSPSA